MATQQFSVQADISEPISMLEAMGADHRKVLRRILAGIGTDAKNKAKRAYAGAGLQKGTSALYRSITRKVVSHGKAVMIEAKAQNEKGIFYGYALTKGARITAKDDGYLTFQINGKWVKKKEVKLSEHDFIEQPVMKYLDSYAFHDKLDRLVQKEIDRIEKENAK